MNEMEEGLRILARIIARAYMKREYERKAEEAGDNQLAANPVKEKLEAAK
jgi:hypothetical protein